MTTEPLPFDGGDTPAHETEKLKEIITSIHQWVNDFDLVSEWFSEFIGSDGKDELFPAFLSWWVDVERVVTGVSKWDLPAEFTDKPIEVTS